METQTQTTDTTLGELIVLLYEEYLALYGDADVASVAAATTLNELFAEEAQSVPGSDRARAA